MAFVSGDNGTDGTPATVHTEPHPATSEQRGITSAPPAATTTQETSTGLPDDRYFNRELSWLDFNARVLALAEDASQPRLSNYFSDQVFPVLTPLAVDPTHRFPYISGLSLNLAVTVRDPEDGTRHFARVKVPDNVPRLIRVADRHRESSFLPLED